MKRKFALILSLMAALLIVTAVLMLTSQPTQAAPLDIRRVAASTAVASKIVVNELYRSGSFNAAGDEWVELLLINDLTAAELNGFYFGDSTSSVAAKFSGYHFTNTQAIAATFLKGTLIVIGGGGVVTDSVSYDPAAGDWNIVLAATGSYLSFNGSTGDFAATDVAYVDTNGTNGNATLSADGFAIKWGTTVGAFGSAANLTVTAPANASGLVFTSTLNGITVPANWATSVVSTSLTRGQPNGGDNTAYIESLRAVLTPESDLGLTKDGPTTALAGENITYTLSLSNTGTASATGTIITDTLPTEVTFVTYTTALPVNTFTQNGQDLIWDLGDVPTTTVNATIGVQVFISPVLPSGTSFTNTVTASTTYTESDQTDNADSVTTFIGAPDLAIVKTGPASAIAGETFTYTLVYSNAGSIAATNVGVVDQLPAGVTFITETTASVVPVNGQLTWLLGTLTSGNGGSLEVVVTADQAGDWVNTATISGGPVDSNLLNNTASVTTTINGADVYVSKSGPTVAFGGELISYTITYGNAGDITATATLTDQLPISFTMSDIAVDTSGLPFAGGVWTPIEIAPNTEVSFTFALTVPTTIANSTRITNSLSISAVEAGDDPADNTASASNTVYQIVPIATARAGAVGQTFGVEGSVIYVPGTYNSSGWALQDASGGIGVFYTPTPTVALGDRVRLVATRSANAGEAQLGSTVRYFANLGSGPQVTPLPFTTAQVAAGAAEGWLAVVTGTVSGVPATCTGNYSLSINDGSGVTVIFIDETTTVNICNLGIVSGDRVVFTGFGTQFNGLMQIKPRFPADVKRLFDVTFIYNDLEDVVQVGEDVQLRGDFNSWAGVIMSHDAGYTVFSASVTLPTTATQGYKYYALAFDGNNLAYDLLNTDNRSFAPTQGVTIKQEYRNTPIIWGTLNGPTSATFNLGAGVVVSGQVYVQSVTAPAGAGRGVKAEMGYGMDANPANWVWSPLTYASEDGNNDVFAGTITPAAGGVYSYALRYDANFGATNPNAGWIYADLNGVPFSLDQSGVLTVTAPQLSLTKGLDKPASEMQPGDVVTYTLDLSNDGDGVANGVLITDVLPVEVTFGGFVQQNGAAQAGGVITWGGTLDAGLTATVVFTTTVGDQRAFYGRTVTNTAQFTSSNGGSDSAEAVFQIVQRYFIFAPLVRR